MITRFLISCIAAVALHPGLAAAEVFTYDPYYYEVPDHEIDLDDRVFDVEPKLAPQTDSTGRYVTKYPRYAPQDRREWLTECAPLKDVDFKRFQECYHDHKEYFLHPERAGTKVAPGNRREAP